MFRFSSASIHTSPPSPPSPPSGPPFGIYFAAEAHATITAITCNDQNRCFINKLHFILRKSFACAGVAILTRCSAYVIRPKYDDQWRNTSRPQPRQTHRDNLKGLTSVWRRNRARPVIKDHEKQRKQWGERDDRALTCAASPASHRFRRGAHILPMYSGPQKIKHASCRWLSCAITLALPEGRAQLYIKCTVKTGSAV